MPGRAGSIGNTITVIDPSTGAIGPSVFVGSKPGKLAISGDGQYLYVALDGGSVGAVRRVHIPSLTPGLEFSLGVDQIFGLYVEDMEVLPGHPEAVAVSRQYQGGSPRRAGVAIYDDGIKRPLKTPDHTGSNIIEFSGAASTLYGLNTETTEFGFRRMSVDGSGVSVIDTTQDLVPELVTDMKFDNGRIYTNTGRVIDFDTPHLVGTFPGFPVFGALVKPDSMAKLVYFLTAGDTIPRLLAFHQDALAPEWSLTIPGIVGTAGSLVRWGKKGIAFRTSGDQVFLMKTPIRSSDYFPIFRGSEWTYLEEGERRVTTRVLDQTVIVGGVETRVLRDDDGINSYISSDSTGVRLHRLSLPSVFIEGLGLVDLELTFDSPVQMMNGVAKVGETAHSTGVLQTNSLPLVGVIRMATVPNLRFRGSIASRSRRGRLTC